MQLKLFTHFKNKYVKGYGWHFNSVALHRNTVVTKVPKK